MEHSKIQEFLGCSTYHFLVLQPLELWFIISQHDGKYSAENFCSQDFCNSLKTNSTGQGRGVKLNFQLITFKIIEIIQ